MSTEADRPPSLPDGEHARIADVAPAIRRAAAVRRGWHTAGLGVALAALAVPLLTACGSASGAPAADASAISATCTAVGAALSDGPDPGADPVGYAEAQIRPLRAIETSDHALRAAIRDLATAYAQVFASNGTSGAASKAVTAAASKVNAICPGATS
jgi:hypothetical protein